ncbi:MAG: type II toxin-antitoxin system RelE/ParE family toxin [Thiotrichaceae bacterium]|nr:type II toxin-antitoxin system RelE/ParE family toxin [Thiotrichaceae bacterium]
MLKSIQTDTIILMYEIKSTEAFSKWLSKLKDMKGRIAVARRIERMQYGNFGDVKSVGTSISELRITTGPGYRIYFTQKEDKIIILLIGGDKSTQSKDIEKAKQLLKEYNNE